MNHRVAMFFGGSFDTDSSHYSARRFWSIGRHTVAFRSFRHSTPVITLSTLKHAVGRSDRLTPDDLEFGFLSNPVIAVSYVPCAIDGSA